MTQPSNEKKQRSIALAITGLETGGAEKALVQLAVGLAKRNWRVRVDAIAPPPSAPRDGLTKTLAEHGIPVHFLGYRSGWMMPAVVPLVVHRWTKAWREWKPDVAQSFLFHANVTAAWAARRAGVRIVCSGIRVADPRRWRHTVERWSLRWVDRAICVSESVARFCESTARFPAEKVVTIPNCVDVDRYQNAAAADLRRLGVPPGQRVMTCVGRLDVQKGLDWLLPLLPPLFERHTDVDLLLVGNGPQEASLRQRGQQLGIADRLHFVGWQNDVPAILKASSVLLLPSRWEGMPNVVLEAMAAALPVVATQVEGVSEILGNENRQIVALEDKSGFIDCIEGTLAHTSRGKELGQANLARVASEYSIDRMIERYLEVYGQLEGD